MSQTIKFFTLSLLLAAMLAGCGEAHYAGGGAFSFVVGNDNGLAALHDGDTAVCSAQVNADRFAHDVILSFLFF